MKRALSKRQKKYHERDYLQSMSTCQPQMGRNVSCPNIPRNNVVGNTGVLFDDVVPGVRKLEN